MKYLIIISLGILLTLFSACGAFSDLQDNTYDAVRRFINESGQDVAIEIYNDEESYSYEISMSDTLDLEGECDGGPGSHCFLGGWRRKQYGEIIFADGKLLLYVGATRACDEKAINTDPIGGCSGYTRTDVDGLAIYTYRITHDDYLLAE